MGGGWAEPDLRLCLCGHLQHIVHALDGLLAPGHFGRVWGDGRECEGGGWRGRVEGGGSDVVAEGSSPDLVLGLNPKPVREG